MKAHPIIFSAPMVRALLEGRKTQTRRIIKPQPSGQLFPREGKTFWMPGGFSDSSEPVDCRYGGPGDLLWVRETWREDSPDDPEAAVYAATPPQKLPSGFRWKPSIHMPRWASRLTLRITDVRVQRLQDISESDAIAEGLITTGAEYSFGDGFAKWVEPKSAYAHLWNVINGRDSWALNSWIWALSFEVIKANVDQVLKEKVK